MILENPKILQILKLVTFKEPVIVITNRDDVYPIRIRLISVTFDKGVHVADKFCIKGAHVKCNNERGSHDMR